MPSNLWVNVAQVSHVVFEFSLFVVSHFNILFVFGDPSQNQGRSSGLVCAVVAVDLFVEPHPDTFRFVLLHVLIVPEALNVARTLATTSGNRDDVIQVDDVPVHVTGKYLPEETHNLVRDGVEFQFDGLAEEATLRTNTAQNQIYQFVLKNPDCHQKTIVNELEMKKGNVSRDIKKLIETGMVFGNSTIGYRVNSATIDNFDNSDN